VAALKFETVDEAIAAATGKNGAAMAKKRLPMLPNVSYLCPGPCKPTGAPMLLNDPEASIVVLGEAMLDIFVTGDVERISPEAPVPVLRHRRDKLVPGGAGNVACNIANLGGAPILITLIGDDSEGASLLALLGAEGVTTEAVVTKGRMTTSKTRLMGGSHHLMRIDREDSSPISGEIEDEVLAKLRAVLPRALWPFPTTGRAC